jgi:hypothetical protein
MISENIIVSSTADNGGGIFASGSATLINNVITGNQANQRGDGVNIG